jgi:hypothetical protein
MTTKFSMTRDINGFNGFGLVPSDTNYSATLTVSTDTTVTVPSAVAIGKQGPSTSSTAPISLAIITSDPGTTIWVAINATAAVPVGATFAATSSMMNPGAIEVKGGDVIHVISSGTGVNVGVRFYSLA